MGTMTRTVAFLIPAFLLSMGCSSRTSFVKAPETTLGRVVVYRNGVAYFERYADVEGDALHLQVPSDKVDDFLKSLTVADARTNAPEPVVYPTDPPSSDTGMVDMKILLSGAKPHKLKLTYVTESPSWKPSYRITLGTGGKIQVQAWAIVDNTSGEDWKAVKLGVGASSAMSFRFDLRHIRVVDRETLRPDDLFAQAPPMGGATYGGQQAKNVLAEIDDATLTSGLKEGKPEKSPAPVAVAQAASRRDEKTYKSAARSNIKKSADEGEDYESTPSSPSGGPSGSGGSARRKNQQNMDQISQSLNQTRGQIVIEGYANREDKDKMAASLDRANKAREVMIRNGVAPERVAAVGRGEQPGKNGGVRVVEVPIAPKEAPPPPPKDGKAPAASTTEPIGTSHFESESPMTVPRGTSAMVSILNTPADGEVVYLYDPESPRGNVEFPFRSVRLKNPTECALESGPVTVFGEGRFIGEGMSEPIPAHAQAFVPFALDRQIVIERKNDEKDAIRRVLTVQRGVFHTEIQHARHTTLTLHNRLTEKATVYVKHSVPAGYTLAKKSTPSERLGESYLFKVIVEPGSKSELKIEESTPIFSTTDIRSPEGMGLIRAYLSSAVVEGPLRKQVDELLRLNTEMTNIDQRIASTRDQMAEYRTRMDELHAQIVTLRMVKMTSGNLLTNLERKLADISDKLSKATVTVVDLQGQLMVARIKFQDGVAELSLEKQPDEAKK
jgi:outer membrane protein OmpA-like peptidoglycan-associated protein